MKANGNAFKPGYKFWVENSGNNHSLVKQILKKRIWLTPCSDYTPPSQGANHHHYHDGKNNSLFEDEDDQNRTGPHIIWTQLRRTKIMRTLTLDQIYNHIDGINTIATKSSLFLTLKEYYKKSGINVFDVVPETYLINVDGKNNFDIQKKERQLEEFQKICGSHIWILKPGENTNRGHGIQMFDDVRKIIHSINNEYLGHYKTVILQKYISNPYLIAKRKFDFRVYSLLTY